LFWKKKGSGALWGGAIRGEPSDGGNGTLCLKLRLRVLDWAAWAPGLENKSAWQEWARSPSASRLDRAVPWPASGAVPPADAVPPILRRRAGLSDRLALEVAYALAPKGANIPSVFASRHGQILRSTGLLESLAQGTPMSPMDFSVSVHNATAGFFSIARGDRSPASALAGGRESFSAALLESQALLDEGAGRVLAVYHDEDPPKALDTYWDGEAAGWSLALVLGHQDGTALDMKLEDETADDGGDAGPQALAVARLLAKGWGEEHWFNGRHRWTWGIPA
jgi:hypothetical protein